MGIIASGSGFVGFPNTYVDVIPPTPVAPKTVVVANGVNITQPGPVPITGQVVTLESSSDGFASFAVLASVPVSGVSLTQSTNFGPFRIPAGQQFRVRAINAIGGVNLSVDLLGNIEVVPSGRRSGIFGKPFGGVTSFPG